MYNALDFGTFMYEIYGKPYKENPTDLLNDLTSYQATSCFTLCYTYQLKVNNEKTTEQYSKFLRRLSSFN